MKKIDIPLEKEHLALETIFTWFFFFLHYRYTSINHCAPARVHYIHMYIFYSIIMCIYIYIYAGLQVQLQKRLVDVTCDL